MYSFGGDRYFFRKIKVTYVGCEVSTECPFGSATFCKRIRIRNERMLILIKIMIIRMRIKDMIRMYKLKINIIINILGTYVSLSLINKMKGSEIPYHDIANSL